MTTPQATNMPEQIFLETASAKVTNARAVIGEKTYAMANITSVGINRSISRLGRVLVILGGLVLLYPLWELLYIVFLSVPLAHSGIVFALMIGVPGGVLALVGLLLNKNARATHVLTLYTASGEIKALTSKNLDNLRQISQAIANAMIARG